ncbi:MULTISPECIES: SRPBCC domain-containing protein [Haloferax]|uniref:SRPBCC domain-containing protein n=1 Tax=Haloferax marinum TaxID=2666143 RepID=A0A6A8GD45_9EURY|nr:MULTISPECIES: SRPBCC domain-containing protein [Haloferax]KAB1191203.1 SRPBCC domain-containing protein [Haloferax sp. CBA1150]MRW98093.1 SRPBCC domain-containing protein [Haloferax marinum]
MSQLSTSIDIDAPAETVWEVLTDFDSYPEWNGYTHIAGTPEVGATLVVSPGPKAGRLPTFKPTVLQADDGELRWLGHLFVRGLFDGEHRFVVEDLGEGRSRLTQSETFSGILVGVVNRLFGADTRRNFEAVNEALKARAEALVASGVETGADDTAPEV